MKYKFKYNLRTIDLWKLSLYGIYTSLIGLINIIFIISIVLLIIRFWSVGNIFVKVLLIFTSLIFTLFQPLILYLRAKKQVETFPKDMYLGFDRQGMSIETDDNISLIKWEDIAGIKELKNIIIIYSSGRQGYLMTNKILGNKKQEFHKYLVENLKKYRKS